MKYFLLISFLFLLIAPGVAIAIAYRKLRRPIVVPIGDASPSEAAASDQPDTAMRPMSYVEALGDARTMLYEDRHNDHFDAAMWVAGTPVPKDRSSGH